MIDKIEISREKAIEIIEQYCAHNDYAFSKIEKILINKGILEDCGMVKEFWVSIKELDNKMLTTLLEVI